MDNLSNSYPTGGIFDDVGGAWRSPTTDTHHNGKNSATGSPLGSITELQVIGSGGDFEQNSPVSFDEKTLALVERFSLQDIACSILTQKEKRTSKDGSSYDTYVHRVNYCLKQRVDATRSIFVRYNEKRQKAHYDNLQRCGSPWTCPFCAVQITEGRRIEVKTAMDNYRKSGGYVYLVTFTNRHHVGDDLAELLKGQQKAMTKLWEKTKVKNMVKCLGYEGRITACEVTYGKNGWHPHYHVLMFFDHEINTDALQSFMALEWQIACGKVGMKLPTLEHGVDVQKGDKADAYVAKWGLEHEMTKGHTKKGKEDGLTPFDLLRQSGDNPHYRTLFKQFADVFKGKQQLYWSNGLKARLGVANRTDEELAEETEKESIEIQEVATQIWRLVLRYKLRSLYLRAVEQDYLENSVNERVYNLIMPYAQVEQSRLNALERERLRE